MNRQSDEAQRSLPRILGIPRRVPRALGGPPKHLGVSAACGLLVALAAGACKGKNATDASSAETGADASGPGGDDGGLNGGGGLTDGALTDGGAGTYAAFYLPGGLDRIHIVKTDPTRDVCFVVGLAGPSSSHEPGRLTLPEGWELEFARALQPAGACEPNYDGSIAGGAEAQSASGTIAWEGSLPQTIASIAIELAFPPFVESMSATDIPVK